MAEGDRKMVLQDRDGGVVILTLNYPERRNALAMPLKLALLDALRKIERDRDVRAVIITGAAGNFCAGGDVTSMGEHDLDAARQRMRESHDIARLLASFAKPLIAAVEGWAAGAGVSFALLCDTIVAAENARFKPGFGDIGLVADGGMLHTLPQRIGIARTKQLLYYGEVVNAPEALAWGMVDRLAPPGGALDEAKRLAGLLAARAPLPIGATKAALVGNLEGVLALERELQAMMHQSHDHAEGQKAFLEKRKPRFTGR
jgi:enoyl-CoA hydratase/carnithine racemase